MTRFEYIQSIARQLLFSSVSEYSFLIMYLFLYIIIKSNYQKTQEFVSENISEYRRSNKNIVEGIILTGLLAGFVCGVFFVSIGISINVFTLRLIILLTFLLAIFNNRYICIAYSGSLIALYGAITKNLQIDVSSLLVIIAIMHFVESILIYINRKNDCMPIYIIKDGKIAGGFLNQRYWVVPIIAICLFKDGSVLMINNEINIHWSTIFNSDLIIKAVEPLILVSALSIIRYSEVSTTKLPDKASGIRSVRTMIYSIILFILAVLSKNNQTIQIVSSIFALLGHEVIILYAMYRENKDSSMFTVAENGVRILDLIPNSHAEKMKIQKGEIILSINGKTIQTEEGIKSALNVNPTFIWMVVKGIDGRHKRYEYKNYPQGVRTLGIIFVPRESEVTYGLTHFDKYTILRNIVEKFRYYVN